MNTFDQIVEAVIRRGDLAHLGSVRLGDRSVRVAGHDIARSVRGEPAVR